MRNKAVLVRIDLDRAPTHALLTWIARLLGRYRASVFVCSDDEARVVAIEVRTVETRAAIVTDAIASALRLRGHEVVVRDAIPVGAAAKGGRP